MTEQTERCAWIAQQVSSDALAEDELQQILMTHIHNAHINPNDDLNRVHYFGPEGGLLTLKYNKRGLVEIEAGDALSDHLLSAIVSDVKREVATTEQRVWRRVLFSAIPCETSWRYNDRFQITPPPENAPRPNTIMGEHPFVLEFKAPASTDFAINGLRCSRVIQELTLLLDVVLRFGANGLPRYSQHVWGLVVEQPVPELRLRTEYIQRGYFIEGWNPQDPDFSDTFPRCHVVPSEEYFAQPGILPDTVFSVPALAEPFFDAFYALDNASRDRILRACYWYHVADEFWRSSHSAAFTALVQAIEVLVDWGSGAGQCPECGRSLDVGPTAKFSEFVDRYAAGTDATARRHLYSLRSDLTHGRALFLRDRQQWMAGLHPQSTGEESEHRQLRVIAREVIINRLLATPDTPL